MKTKVKQESGLEVGIRMTFPLTVEEAWSYLISPTGIQQWLGLKFLHIAPGQSFEGECFKGCIQVVKQYSHIRMMLKKTEWSEYSVLQVRIFKAVNGMTLSFHQDKLADEFQRSEMLLHWRNILETVDSELHSVK